MTKSKVYTLKWKYLTSNLNSSLSDVFAENNFSDVTLVSDDQIPFQAHRYVLSAFSPVFKSMLQNHPDSHPLIYLRGVNQQELDLILQFIYLGVTSVYHSNMNRFSQAAQDLKIKNLVDNTRMVDLENRYYEHNQNIHENSDNQDQNDYVSTNETTNGKTPSSDEVQSGKQLHTRIECVIGNEGNRILNNQTQSYHKGIQYYCKYCKYNTIKQSNLRRHVENIHEGLKYPCNQCNYKASQQSHLKSHQRSIHEGVKYSCTQCGKQFTTQGEMRNHQQSIHEGVRYSCDQCASQFTLLRSLKVHMNKKHPRLE